MSTAHESMVQSIEEAQQPGRAVLLGITSVLTPTIMQAGQGGYIVAIPRIGVAAKSSFEEVLDFLGHHAAEHFRHPVEDMPLPPPSGSDVPRIVLQNWKGAVENKIDGLSAAGMGIVTIAVSILGSALGFIGFMKFTT